MPEPKTVSKPTRRKSSQLTILEQNTVTRSQDLDSVAKVVEQLSNAALDPSSALALVTGLIAEVPSASKESMDRIKMIDKLLNTARSMMETKIKTHEATIISQRIDDLEGRVDAIITARFVDSLADTEEWNGFGVDN